MPSSSCHGLREGIAGSRSLSLAGMIYFAVAHTVFFVLLAALYNYVTRGYRRKWP
jgi:hypothetical protein